jgi:hypothetical protein
MKMQRGAFQSIGGDLDRQLPPVVISESLEEIAPEP